MTEIKWLTVQMVTAFHNESIVRFGGLDGTRDQGLLESALARPQNMAAYEEPDIFELAASYCVGIVRNHPFVDGNKRTGLLAARVFLSLNGYHFNPGEVETVRMITGLAAGEFDLEDLSQWLSNFSVRKPVVK